MPVEGEAAGHEDVEHDAEAPDVHLGAVVLAPLEQLGRGVVWAGCAGEGGPQPPAAGPASEDRHGPHHAARRGHTRPLPRSPAGPDRRAGT